ncbi:hypothetical protein E2C01_055544 [Portunus trituberculatus]|uniref:Uncharacterized protein n=1 Tax=Portunus trituberculatus TaxID=210409 RepID=A0A5B7GRH3_PORTR|nr:hypothetical protein [Portunus trituberculatus]
MALSRLVGCGRVTVSEGEAGGLRRKYVSDQDHVRILGVDLDRELLFDCHLKHIVHQTSLLVFALRRAPNLLDKRGFCCPTRPRYGHTWSMGH